MRAMESALSARIREILDAGGGEGAGELRFLPLVTLESGARVGLDPDGKWVFAPGDERPPVRIADDNVYRLQETVEQKRREFEDTLEAAAKAHALPPADVVFSFPALALVRAVLTKQSSYLSRLALEWLLPSELREMRAEIVAVVNDERMPRPLRDFATRLVVPA